MALHQLDGVVHAPEFPSGCDWLNTDRPLTLEGLKGKIVLLDFWTFCCVNCMHVLPELKRLEEKYADVLVVIGVHSGKFQNEKESDAIFNAIARYEIEHPVINDAEYEIWQSYGIKAWPSFMLINPTGRIVGSHSGEGMFGLFDKLIGQLVTYFDNQETLIRSPRVTQSAQKNKASLAFPGKILATAERLFIADSNHNRVLVADLDGQVVDLIGRGVQGQADGVFEDATFYRPQGLCLEGDRLYIADTENHLIREANFATRQVCTVLGTGEQARRFNVPGTGTLCALNSPWDLVIVQGAMYVAMAGAHQIWWVDLNGWHARPYAGSAREDLEDGPLLTAALAQPSGITTDGASLFFVDSESSSVRLAPLDHNGQVDTLVGAGLFAFGDRDGALADGQLQHPIGLASEGALLYVADSYNNKIKVIDQRLNTINTCAGTGGSGAIDGELLSAEFNEPSGVSVCGNKLYVADTNNHAIRIIDLESKRVSTLEIKL